MVNLTRIYTRTGDAGQTRLSDNTVAPKTDPRIEAYGQVDEANSAIGLALAFGELPDTVSSVLSMVQNELFDVGADLSNPVVANPQWEPLRIIEESIDRLEAWCDEFGADLPDLRSFILPAGTKTAAQLHVARTITRRAERWAWRAAEHYGLEDETAKPEGGINVLAIKYLNRLSDLLFILARVANRQGPGGSEVLWKPGGERENPNPKRRPKG